MENNLYTVKQAADFLGVHENTILRWIQNNTLPAIKLGRVIRIKKEDLERKS